MQFQFRFTLNIFARSSSQHSVVNVSSDYATHFCSIKFTSPNDFALAACKNIIIIKVLLF